MLNILENFNDTYVTVVSFHCGEMYSEFVSNAHF